MINGSFSFSKNWYAWGHFLIPSSTFLLARPNLSTPSTLTMPPRGLSMLGRRFLKGQKWTLKIIHAADLTCTHYTCYTGTECFSLPGFALSPDQYDPATLETIHTIYSKLGFDGIGDWWMRKCNRAPIRYNFQDNFWNSFDFLLN